MDKEMPPGKSIFSKLLCYTRGHFFYRTKLPRLTRSEVRPDGRVRYSTAATGGKPSGISPFPVGL